MPLYRIKPVTIEAFQLTDYSKTDKCEKYNWFEEAVKNGYVKRNKDKTVTIKTLKGEMKGNIGDYIIKGVKDEIYRCKPDIFEKTYDEV